MTDDSGAGGPIVSLMVSQDGKQRLCCICFEWCIRDDLEPVSDEPGKVWDVCKSCAVREKAQGGIY